MAGGVRGGTEKRNNCPVVVELHNDACRAIKDDGITLGEAAQIATELLVDNNRGIVFTLDDGKKLKFSEAEIDALYTLMMTLTPFGVLAPYSPLGAQEMW